MFTSRCATALWSRFRLQIVLSRRHGSRGGRGFLSVVLRLRHVASQGHPNSSQPSAIPSISAREPKISGKGTEEILRVGKLVRSSLRSCLWESKFSFEVEHLCLAPKHLASRVTSHQTP